MHNYLNLLEKILLKGEKKTDRTGTGTLSLFGERLEINMRKGFPLLTTKRINYRAVLSELLWFISGSTNVKDLHKVGCHIWDEWAGEDGELGPIYGSQWRSWNGKHDQLSSIISKLKENPNDRRLVVSSWNVEEIDNMALPPCHLFYQFYLGNKGLSLQMYMRSADIFLGVPFNIASYATLLLMVSKLLWVDAHKLIIVFGDVHLYTNHKEQAREQLSRIPRKLPKLEIEIRRRKNIDDFQREDFIIHEYNPYPHIPAPIAV